MVDDVISQDLLNVLACPMCKSDVELKGSIIFCMECKRKYPIEDGIPNMLPDDLR